MRCWSLFVTGVSPCLGQVATVRYYGRQPSEDVPAFPGTVCRTYAAICINLAIDTCLQAPGQLLAPFNVGAEYHEYNVDSGYLMLKDWNGSLELWSGCDAGCGDCSAGTGGVSFAWGASNLCSVTVQGGVFALMDFRTEFDEMRASINCASNIPVVDAGSGEDIDGQSILIVILVVFGSMVGCGVLMCCAIWGLLLCCVYSMRRQPQTMRQLRESRISPEPSVIGQERIERAFPVTPAEQTETCVVCLVPVEQREHCCVLQCGHLFHPSCILKWWTHVPRDQLQCPVCTATQELPEVVDFHPNEGA